MIYQQILDIPTKFQESMIKSSRERKKLKLKLDRPMCRASLKMLILPFCHDFFPKVIGVFNLIKAINI